MDTRPLLNQVLAERSVRVFVLRFLAAGVSWLLVAHIAFGQAWRSALAGGLIFGLVIAVVVTVASIAFRRRRRRTLPPAGDTPDL